MASKIVARIGVLTGTIERTNGYLQNVSSSVDTIATYRDLTQFHP